MIYEIRHRLNNTLDWMEPVSADYREIEAPSFYEATREYAFKRGWSKGKDQLEFIGPNTIRIWSSHFNTMREYKFLPKGTWD